MLYFSAGARYDGAYVLGGTRGVDMVWVGMADYKISRWCIESRTVVDTSSRSGACNGQYQSDKWVWEGGGGTAHQRLQEGPGAPTDSLIQGNECFPRFWIQLQKFETRTYNSMPSE